MKKTLQIKTMHFSQHQHKTQSESPRRSPLRLFTRTQTLPNQGQLRGFKLVKRSLQPKTLRRLSHNNPNKPLLHQQRQQTQQNRHCFSQSRPRYQQSSETYIKPSHSNSKFSSHHFKEGSYNMSLPPKNESNTHTKTFTIKDFNPSKGISQSQSVQCSDLKAEIMKKISKKVQFMKKMTSDKKDEGIVQAKGHGNSTDSSSLFNFDRLYEHCLKKINKSISAYQRDISRSKDKKYYELKIESSILSKELIQMRNSLVKKKELDVCQNNLGVIGNVIEITKGDRINSHRASKSRGETACFKKKMSRITKILQANNPFARPDTRGWEVGQKPFDFYL